MDDGPLSTRGWSVDALVQLGPRMREVPRISALLESLELEAKIREFEDAGVPIIIEKWHQRTDWPEDKLFGVDWVVEHGDESALAF